MPTFEKKLECERIPQMAQSDRKDNESQNIDVRDPLDSQRNDGILSSSMRPLEVEDTKTFDDLPQNEIKESFSLVLLDEEVAIHLYGSLCPYSVSGFLFKFNWQNYDSPLW